MPVFSSDATRKKAHKPAAKSQTRRQEEVVSNDDDDDEGILIECLFNRTLID